MTPKQEDMIRRLSWLCAEIRAGNMFSEPLLWKWEQEAQVELWKEEEAEKQHA